MHYFIVNPNSRSGKGLLMWKEINNELEKRNIEYSVYFTSKENNELVLQKNSCQI